MASLKKKGDGPASPPLNIGSRRLLANLLADAASRHFRVLPDPFLYPSYYAIITRPICLADIAVFIEAGKYTFEDIQRDLRRLLNNAKRFNLPESQVYVDALTLEVREMGRAEGGAVARAGGYGHSCSLPRGQPQQRMKN